MFNVEKLNVACGNKFWCSMFKVHRWSMYAGVQFGRFHCTNINNWTCVYHHFYRFIASRSQEGSCKCNMRNLRPSLKSLVTVSHASVGIHMSIQEYKLIGILYYKRVYSLIQTHCYSLMQTYGYSLREIWGYSLVQTYDYSLTQIWGYSLIQTHSYSLRQIWGYSFCKTDMRLFSYKNT